MGFLGFRVWGLRFNLGFRVWGLRFSLGFRVWGLIRRVLGGYGVTIGAIGVPELRVPLRDPIGFL